MHLPVIAIDIGNTNTAIALIDTQTLSASCIRYLPTKNCMVSLVDTLTHITPSGFSLDQLPIHLCSVVQSVQHDIVATLSRLVEPNHVNVFRNHQNLPIKIRYKMPQTLGVDRIANCLYAYYRFPGEDVVIVDAGTAIKVDYLCKSGEFLGGCILPGISMQLRSLHRDTDKLPDLCHEHVSLQFPPQSTTEAICCGVYYGTAGSIQSIISRFSSHVCRCMKVIACGGDWPAIAACMQDQYLHIPETTLTGIGLFNE